MSLSTDSPAPYKPPKVGYLSLQLVDGYLKKSQSRVISKSLTQVVHDLSSSTGPASGSGSSGPSKSAAVSSATSYNEKQYLLNFTMDNSIFRFNEAMMIYKLLYQDGINRYFVISEILQRFDAPHDARNFLKKIILSYTKQRRHSKGSSRSSHTKDYEHHMLLLKKYMGSALNPIIGSFNGYYILDLSNSLDFFCFKKLIQHQEQQQQENVLRAKMKNGTSAARLDTSQLGNCSCFRNVQVISSKKGVDIANLINSNTLSSTNDDLPTSGKVSFDYISQSRPSNSEDTIILSDTRFVSLLLKMDIISASEQADMSSYLADLKVQMAKENLFPNVPVSVHKECSFKRAKVPLVILQTGYLSYPPFIYSKPLKR
jgi:hypothetical protein